MYMNKVTVSILRIKGFTLVEMAIVMVIVGLLISAFLVPLSVQQDLKDYSKARTDLEQIKEALYGYALVNGRLPCPDTDGNGNENSPCVAASTGGDLPWLDLGIDRNDPWGRPYRYRVSGSFTGLFTLTSTGVMDVSTDSTLATKVASNIPAVIYTSGKNGGIQPPASADELENTVIAGPRYNRFFVSREFTPVFDDVVVWISSSILFNRMIQAERLP